MKKINLILLAALFITVQACKKDDSSDPVNDNNGGNGGGNNPPEIAQEQKVVGFYFSGNWCGPCGAYGKPTLKAMKEKYGEKFVVIACQLNGGIPDPMNCAEANGLAGNFGVSGVPRLFTGGAGKTISSVGGGTSMESTADGNIAGVIDEIAIANTKVTATISGGDIKVDTKTKFFVEQSEQYRIGVYITEDNIALRQAVGGVWDNDHVHYDILRDVFTANLGDDLTTGASANQEVEMSFTGSLDGNWNSSNLNAVVVLWRVNSNNQSTLVNATSVKIQ